MEENCSSQKKTALLGSTVLLGRKLHFSVVLYFSEVNCTTRTYCSSRKFCTSRKKIVLLGLCVSEENCISRKTQHFSEGCLDASQSPYARCSLASIALLELSVYKSGAHVPPITNFARQGFETDVSSGESSSLSEESSRSWRESSRSCKVSVGNRQGFGGNHSAPMMTHCVP